MDNVDADEIITNSRLRETEKAGGKTIGDGAYGTVYKC